MSVAAAKVLVCGACSRRYKVAQFDPARAYKCKDDGAALGEPPALQLKGEPDKRVWEISVRHGKYIVEGELGRGAMGVVYKGRQEGLNRLVAIKMLLGGGIADAEGVKRFEREAKAAAKLKHPNIVAIHEVGTYKESPFFTMDYVAGRSLDKVISDEGLMPFKKAARLMMTISRAVQHAHEHGIVHRDLKPGNILIDKDGEPHLTDFGLAKDLDNESMLSMTGDVMGTPGYMSPEQAGGVVHDLDARTDVYALGAILYKLLLNKAPHQGPTIAATIYQVVNEYAVDPRRLNKLIPEDLAAVCMKAMEKERDKRYESAEAFAQDLENFLHGRPVTARPLTRREEVTRRVRKHRVAVIVCGAAGAVALVSLLGFLLLRPSYLDVMAEELAGPNAQAAFLALMQKLPSLEPAERERGEELAARYAASTDAVEVRRAVLDYPHAPPAFRALLRKWLAHEEPPDLCIGSIQKLAGAKDHESVSEIRARLDSPNADIRRAAVRAFITMPSLAMIGPLSELMADPDVGPEAREAVGRCAAALDKLSFMTTAAGKSISGALTSLGKGLADYTRQMEDINSQIDPKEDPTDVALQTLRSGTDAERVAACVYLGEIREKRAIEPLLAAIRAGDAAVAPAAADALARIDASAKKNELLALLDDAKPASRLAAVHVLGRCGDPAVAQPLKERIPKESDRKVGAALLDALKRLDS